MRARNSIAILSVALALAGCKRDEVKVYQISREQTSAPPQNETAPQIQTEISPPQLKFILPDGWQKIAPSQMRVASFSVTNANGQAADVGVIPLPSGENDLALVNMWREQLQLPALTNRNAVETASVGNDSAKFFDIASAAPIIDGKFRARILVADLPRGATSWFFKMTGEDSFVAAQKENFLNFLKSVSFNENFAPQNPAAPASETQDENPNANSIWIIPPGWQSLPPSQFLLAQFSIQNSGAEVNVSSLNGEGGGLLANANRWRGQLGLLQISETDLQPLIASVDSANEKISFVDFSGTNPKTGKSARLIGAVVPQNGQTWFYKLMGDPQIVAQQKDAFLKFIQSANYSNAR